MIGLFVFGASIALSAAFGCGNRSAPVWPKAYIVDGKIFIPNAEIEEPFQAWYDGIIGRSRIDYYNGTSKTFQYSDWPTTNGSSVSIVPETTEVFLNKISCFKVDGDSPGSISPQPVLPDMTNFRCAGEGNINGVKAEKWTATVKDEQKTSKYVMWVQWRGDDGPQIPVPVYYAMKGYDSLLASHFDHYYLTYNNYVNSQPTEDTWKLRIEMKCNIFPVASGKSHHIMNPMQEFIQGDQSHHDEEWKEFVKTPFDHKYGEFENKIRKFIFKQNHRFILSHNRAGHGYKLTINRFADRTNDEILMLNGRTNSEQAPGNGGSPFPYSENRLAKKYRKLPEQLDWRIAGAVTPVKDQSICGSCWSFATTGTIEGAYFVKHKKQIRLSEQALVDCSWGYGNDGCDGGADVLSYQWIMKHGGLPLEDEYRYLGIDGKCNVNQVKLHAPVQGYVNVKSRSEAALKVALFEKGPISVSVDASSKSFSFYSHGVYYNPNCKEGIDQLDHVVLAVGYGILDGKKYWLIKNSWSTLWGNDGYILISIEGNDCGISTAPTYVILK